MQIKFYLNYSCWQKRLTYKWPVSKPILRLGEKSDISIHPITAVLSATSRTTPIRWTSEEDAQAIYGSMSSESVLVALINIGADYLVEVRRRLKSLEMEKIQFNYQ